MRRFLFRFQCAKFFEPPFFFFSGDLRADFSGSFGCGGSGERIGGSCSFRWRGLGEGFQLCLQLRDFLLQPFDFLQAGRGCRLGQRDWRLFGVGAGLRGASGKRRHRGLGEFDAPKVGAGFGEFQINVAICGAKTALAENLSHNLFTGALVGEKKQLAVSHGRRKADHGAIFEDQDRLRLFRK